MCQRLLFNKVAHVFSCEFCEISKNTFFTEHLWTTDSDFNDFRVQIKLTEREN